MSMWGGRFDAPADELFKAFNDSLPFDARLVEEDVEGSIAWAKALEKAGVLGAEERERVQAALREIGEAARAAPEAVREAGLEDVHTWVEVELIRRVGDLGKKLHTGRSRNDQVATDLRLWTLRRLAERRQELRAAQVALLRLAEREREAVLPGYTHLQRAQPVLFAHWCLAYFEMLERDHGRFLDAAARAGLCPLGSGALAGTTYRIDRPALARALGFHGVTANSLDAVSDRDFVVEALAACALCGLHLSRLAEDLIFYASSEAGFVELDDSMCSGSSMMPQKKNPDALELIRGKTGRLLGALQSVCVMLKGLPLAYDKDLQEDKEPLFDAMDTLSLCLRVLPVVLEGLRVRADASRAAAEGGYANATDLADYLVRRDVPFRDAHEQAGRIVRAAVERRESIEDLPVAVLKQHAPRVAEDVLVSLTVDAGLSRRDVVGGTAPQQVEAALSRARATVLGNGAAAPEVELRPARLADVDAICRLVAHWADEGENLPRERSDVVTAVQDFGVAVRDGAVVGCGSLTMYTEKLAEIRSLGVDPTAQGGGVGSKLVRHFVERAGTLGLRRVFVLTRAPEFFGRLGFERVGMSTLPEKVWKDCVGCPKRDACDEIAMVLEVEA